MKNGINFEVIVVGNNHVNALGVIRAFGEKGIKTNLLLIGSRKGYIKKSKYIKKIYYSAEDEKEIMQVLMHQIKIEKERCYIIPTGDFIAAVIDKNLDELKQKYIVPNINQTKNEIIKYMNKKAQYELAKKYKFKMARTNLLDLTKNNIENNIYPCILKPAISANGVKSDIRICNNAESFQKAISEFREKKYKNILLQELLDYDYEIDVPGYCNGNITNIPGIIKKINVYPIKRGSACYVKIGKPNIQIIDKLKELFVNINYNGIFDIDLFAKGNEIYLNEINFRNGAISYALTGSKNYIVVNWVYLNEGLVTEDEPIKKEYYFMVEDCNFKLFLSKEISLLEFIKEFIQAKKYAHISLKDLKPLLYKFLYSIKKEK